MSQQQVCFGYVEQTLYTIFLDVTKHCYQIGFLKNNIISVEDSFLLVRQSLLK